MLGNEEIIIKRYKKILNYLSKYMEKYDNNNLSLAKIKTVCEVNNFIKLSEKYRHTEYFKNMPKSFENPKYREYKSEISLNNFIKKIVYQDDKLNNDIDGTDSMNIPNKKNFMKYLEEKKNMHQKIKVKKELASANDKKINIKNKCMKIKAIKKMNVTKKTNATIKADTNKNTNRKKTVIGRSVKLHFKLDDFNNVKGKIYQLGLRIANKNVKTLTQVKNCIKNLEAKLDSYSYKEIQEIITFHQVKKLNPDMISNPYIDVNLHTNSTTIENGFWLYYFVIFKDNKDIVVSDPFSLMSYKQLHKRKEYSFLEKHKDYMMNNKESLYPYYFKSMFYFNENTKSYKLKPTFNFGINFYQKKGIKRENKDSGINLDMKEDFKNNSVTSSCFETIPNKTENYGGSDEVMKDLMPLNPVLGDILMETVSSKTDTMDVDKLNQKFNSTNNNKIVSNNKIDSHNEINNNLNKKIKDINEYSLQHKNEYPSPSLSSTLSLSSSPLQSPSLTFSPSSPSNSSIDDDIQNYHSLDNNLLTDDDLKISKDYLELKYNLLTEEKKFIDTTLRELKELHKHYIYCYNININATKDDATKDNATKEKLSCLTFNLNYLLQKGFELLKYSEELENKIKNISIKISETKDNTFIPVLNYNRDNTFIPVLNYNRDNTFIPVLNYNHDNTFIPVLNYNRDSPFISVLNYCRNNTFIPVFDFDEYSI